MVLFFTDLCRYTLERAREAFTDGAEVSMGTLVVTYGSTYKTPFPLRGGYMRWKDIDDEVSRHAKVNV